MSKQFSIAYTHLHSLHGLSLPRRYQSFNTYLHVSFIILSPSISISITHYPVTTLDIFETKLAYLSLGTRVLHRSARLWLWLDSDSDSEQEPLALIIFSEGAWAI